MKCEASDVCPRKDCPHINIHEAIDEPENNCLLPCDVENCVSGEITIGAVCKEVGL